MKTINQKIINTLDNHKYFMPLRYFVVGFLRKHIYAKVYVKNSSTYWPLESKFNLFQFELLRIIGEL